VLNLDTNLVMETCEVSFNETQPCNSSVLTVKFRQPSNEFTFGVGMTFVSYPVVLTPVV
jgi:hypothetical protein